MFIASGAYWNGKELIRFYSRFLEGVDLDYYLAGAEGFKVLFHHQKRK